MKLGKILIPILIGTALVLATGGFGAVGLTGLTASVHAIGLGLVVSGALGLAIGLTTRTARQGPDDSPAMHLGQMQNQRGEGEPIPLIYGERQIVPLAISSVIDVDGGTDVIERVLLLGWGPLCVFSKTDDLNSSVTNTAPRNDDDYNDLVARITVNDDLPLRELDPKAYVKVHEFTTDGTFEGFSRRGRPIAQEPTSLQKGVTHVHTMKDAADAVYVVFDWPSGLLRVDSEGNARDTGGGVLFEYRAVGATTWTAMDLGGEAKATGKFTSVWEAGKDNPDWSGIVPVDKNYSVVAGRYFVISKTRAHVRRVAKFNFPSRGAYEVRFTGVTDDTLNASRAPTVGSVIEMDFGRLVSENLAGVVALGIKMRATDQLRGVDPVFRVRCKGRKIKKVHETGTGFTDNAVAVLRDVLRHDKAGLGRWTRDADIPDGTGENFQSIASTLEAGTFTVLPEKGGQAVTEKLGRCNLAIDSSAPTRTWVNQILATGRLSIYESQGQLKLFLDEAKSVSRTFECRTSAHGRLNTAAGEDGSHSLVLAEQPQREKVNRVLIRYVDAADGWRQRTAVEPPTSATIGVTEPEVKMELTLAGVTSRAQAIYLARYVLQRATDSQWFAQWGTGFGDADVEPGNRVTVNAEWPEWTSDTMDFTVLAVQYGMDPGERAVLITGRQYAAGGTGTIVSQLGWVATRTSTGARVTSRTKTATSASTVSTSGAKTRVVAKTISRSR